MPSQLANNPKISFVVAKPFTSRGKTYSVGEDFPQEDARDIDTMVRARFVIPVVDSIEDKQHIRHWHRHIRPKDEVLERLRRVNVQLVMPGEEPPVQPEPDEDEEPSEEVGEFDPTLHTVNEVNAYLAEVDDDERERVLQIERENRERKGILEE